MGFAQQKITVWCWDPNFNVYAMKQAAMVYNKNHPDVTINVVDMAQDIEAKISAGLQAGGRACPTSPSSRTSASSSSSTTTPDAFVDLKAAGVDYSQVRRLQGRADDVGNKIYGIPFDTGSTGLWLRTDYIKAAGINPDSYIGKKLTWSEVIKLGEHGSRPRPANPCLPTRATISTCCASWSSPPAASSSSPTDRSISTALPSRSPSALFKELNDKGLLYSVVGWSDWVNAINSDQSAGFLNAIWMVGTVKSRPENAGKYMIIPTPKIEGVPGACQRLQQRRLELVRLLLQPQQGRSPWTS